MTSGCVIAWITFDFWVLFIYLFVPSWKSVRCRFRALCLCTCNTFALSVDRSMRFFVFLYFVVYIFFVFGFILQIRSNLIMVRAELVPSNWHASRDPLQEWIKLNNVMAFTKFAFKHSSTYYIFDNLKSKRHIRLSFLNFQRLKSSINIALNVKRVRFSV